MYRSQISTSKCDRCNFDVSDREDECPHCKGLTNTEANSLRENYKKEAVKTNAGLAKNFLIAFVITLIIMIFIATV